MLPLGRTRYVDFRLATIDGTPITGRTLASWRTSPSQLIFLRNNAACADELSVHDYGDGHYTVSYSPTAAGHDYLMIYDQPSDIRTIDVEDLVPPEALIGGGSVAVLNQDYGGTGALLVTLSQPETYTLQVYQSSDWDQNRRVDAYALGSSAVNADGSWVSSVSVPPGSYHIVLSKFREQTILKAYLEVD